MGSASAGFALYPSTDISRPPIFFKSPKLKQFFNTIRSPHNLCFKKHVDEGVKLNTHERASDVLFKNAPSSSQYETMMLYSF
jgi:hypothetical protein